MTNVVSFFHTEHGRRFADFPNEVSSNITNESYTTVMMGGGGGVHWVPRAKETCSRAYTTYSRA